MDLSRISCAQPQAAAPVPAPDAPIQLQIPSIPALPAPRRRTRHRKAFWIPEHLVFGIEDDDFTALDERAYPPVLYTHDGNTLHPATERDIFTSAEALLLRRFRRGVPIAHYPRLLKRMLQSSLGRNRRSAFFAFYLDDRGCLIQMAELFRGTTGEVHMYPKEVVRHALNCDASQVLCARTDPSGRAEPTEWDAGCAKRLRYTFQKIDMLLVDYVVVGKTMTSLAEQGCFRPEAMRMYM